MRIGALIQFIILALPVLALAQAPEGFQPWNGRAVDEWTGLESAIVLTDLTKGEPADAFSNEFKKGHWKIIPYEMRADTGGYQGKAIWCGYESDPPEVKIALDAEGWYAIFVGLLSDSGAYVKLEGDQAPLWLSNGSGEQYVNTVDTFFKVAELSEDSVLCFRPKVYGARQAAGITHIMLIPLSPAEIERVQKDRADTSQRTMAATYDNFSPICGNSPRSAEDCRAEMEPYRHTDFGTIIIHGAWSGDKTTYPSKVGHMPGLELEDPCQSYHRDFIDSVRTLAAKNINPLKEMIEAAHEMGMKVHVGIRPAGWSYYQPFNGLWDSPFYLNNPQWRCVDRNGVEITRMSWAVPEVRRHIIDLLAEQVGFGADGAHIVFNRGWPMVLYEKPFRDKFVETYDVDPTELEPEDPRVIAMRCDIIDTFFQELRAELDREEERRADGAHIQISVMVLGTEENNKQYGVDIRRLVKEKLLDAVYVYPFDFGQKNPPPRGVIDWNSYDSTFFRDACQSNGVPFYPTIDPPYDVQGQLSAATDFYEEGVAGLTFFDAGGVDVFTWAIQSRLGHVQEVLWRRDNLETQKPPRHHRFFKLWGDQRLDVEYPPFWGG